MGDVNPIVLDNGTGFCRAGFAGSEQPFISGRCAVGHSFGTTSDVDQPSSTCFVGKDLVSKRPNVRISYPMKNGIVTEWEHMQCIWEHIFLNEMKVDPSNHSILITEAPLNPKSNRETMAEVMFDIFNVPALYVAIPSVLTLYSLSRTSGLVLDCGEGVTSVVPIQDGYALAHAIMRQNLAGRDVTHYLGHLLRSHTMQFPGHDKEEIIRELKEAMSYLKPKACEVTSTSDLMATYILPDGNMIKLGCERFQCAEALFNPSLMGVEAYGVHELVHSSVAKCDTDIRRNLFANVILTGGSTIISGFDCRIHGDLSRMAPPSVKVEIVTPSERPCSAWIGGSILASLSLFGNMCITKKEYEESGSGILHTLL
ncbi:actin-like [Ctenocephalides felis]|uniref:actin-like n=1 Tax=Ctenocephalides felis TaxID=7515 RepID=UPI000E6E43D8|nr:actin-like [Ctenocephalides felis]